MFYLIEEERILDKDDLKKYLTDKYKLHCTIRDDELESVCSLLNVKVIEYKEDKPPTISWKSVRKYRDKLLAETDWVVNSDVLNKESLLAYRQILRDITFIFDEPESVIFPKMPKPIVRKKERKCYSNDELEKIKNRMNSIMLEEWSNLNFINDVETIRNIIKLYETT